MTTTDRAGAQAASDLEQPERFNATVERFLAALP